MVTHKWVELFISLDVSDICNQSLISLESSGVITSSNFVNNYASEKGGALFLSGFNAFKIGSGTTFTKN